MRARAAARIKTSESLYFIFKHCTYLAIGGHVAALEIEAEAEAMALEEELSRSTPPGGVAALAATPSAAPDGDLEAAT